MRTITVDEEAFGVFRAGAAAAGFDDSRWLKSLMGMDRLTTPVRVKIEHPRANTDTAAAGAIRIFSEYKGARIEAEFNRTSHHVQIMSGLGALVGRSFTTPSAAGSAVIRELSPGRHPNVNGWIFWNRCDGRGNLDSLRQA